MRWFPVGVPTASDNAFMDAAYFGTLIAAHISNATAVASTLTIDANNEVIVYSGGILNVTHSITVDGSGAALIVVDNGAVGIATSSILNIGLASDASNVTPALIIQGNGGAVIGPTTVSLNSAVAQIDFELGGSYTFGNVVTGVGRWCKRGLQP